MSSRELVGLLPEYKRLTRKGPLSDEDKGKRDYGKQPCGRCQEVCRKRKRSGILSLRKPHSRKPKPLILCSRKWVTRRLPKYNAFVYLPTTPCRPQPSIALTFLKRSQSRHFPNRVFWFNEAAKQTWESSSLTRWTTNKVAEWLTHGECLVWRTRKEDTGFLAQKRKMDMEREEQPGPLSAKRDKLLSVPLWRGSSLPFNMVCPLTNFGTATCACLKRTKRRIWGISRTAWLNGARILKQTKRKRQPQENRQGGAVWRLERPLPFKQNRKTIIRRIWREFRKSTTKMWFNIEIIERCS